MADDAPEPDLDALAAFLAAGEPSVSDLTIEAVVTLAEHRDRRVVGPIIDLLTSGRADELVVRAAGWFADPGLHPALVALAEGRPDDPTTSPEGLVYWAQVERAVGRCRPDAAAEAEEIEVTLLAATQASVLEVDGIDLDVRLEGTYPTTEIVLSAGEAERRHAIWNFDILNPDEPATLDRQFTLFRIGSLT
ncbi:MAG: hypothetical protein KDA98_05665 [Acidimicrobiales bacterium]|nr:hypothetical protein [Acidimicrobiales bacterium]